MLDSPVAMKQALFLFLLLIFPLSPVRVQVAYSPSITSPVLGQALQGTVAITGTTAVDRFAEAELGFSYAADSTSTWFLIAKLDEPVFEGVLGSWDTTSITDGDYILRLRVTLTDGTSDEVLVSNLRVRNYTPIETPTPAPTAVLPTVTPALTSTASPYPTPTALPSNPAELKPVAIWSMLAAGGLTALMALGLLGAYLWLKRK